MKNKISAAAILLITVVLLTCTVLSPSASTEGYDRYDYSHYGSPSNVTLSSADIVSGILEDRGEALSEAERAFLDSFGTLSLTYSNVLSTDNVNMEYSGGILKVSASDYSYTAAAGELIWHPVSISVSHGEALEIGSGVWELELSAEEVESFSCTVDYEAEVGILHGDIDLALNLWYSLAKYVAEGEDYKIKLELYREYRVAKRIYDEASALYKAYLEKYGQYKEDLAAYEQYERDLAAYSTAYNEYVSYLAAKEQYDKELLDYNYYLENMEKVAHQLAAIELCWVKMTDNRSLYGAVMGGTVDEVLNNESVITGMLGVDATVVHRAGDATERVRALMSEYRALETEAEKYNYYLINYESFRGSFKELTVTLDKLYRYPRVRGTLIAEGKDKKYIILVAQLALVTNALTDGEVKDYDGNVAYGSSWTIEKQTIDKILGGSHYTDTDSAAPIAGGYPTEILEPVAPIEVKKPTKPIEPKHPIEPDAVQDPGPAPTPVDEPHEPVAAFPRVTELDQLIDGDTRCALTDAYRSGACAPRPVPDNSFLYILRQSIVRTYSNALANVTFFGTNGEQLYSTSVECGSSVAFPGLLPVKPDDEFGSYMFIGWKDGAGNPVSLADISATVSLYPDFDRAPTYYNVTWSVNGKSITERLMSGTVPSCPLPTAKADEGSFYYVFEGWDIPVQTLSHDVTYTAVYSEHYKVPFKNGGAILYDDGHTVTVDSHLAFQTRHDLSRILPEIAGERDLILKTSYGTVAFSFTDVMRMHAAGAVAVDVRTVQKGISEARYRISLFDAAGAEILGTGISAKVELGCGIENAQIAKLFSELDGTVKYSSFDYLNGSVNATLTCGIEYCLQLRYTVTVAGNRDCEITVNTDTAQPGELVTITVSPVNDTVRLTDLVITDEAGNPVVMEGKSSFRMPYGNVTVMQLTEIKYYTVSFIASGKTVLTYKVMHGTVVTPPEAPRLESDNLYSYAFVSWYPRLRSITSDTVFYAQYERTLLPREPEPSGIKVTDGVLRLIVLGGVACGLLVVGVIPSTVILTIRIRKRRKMTVKNAKMVK